MEDGPYFDLREEIGMQKLADATLNVIADNMRTRSAFMNELSSVS